MQLLENNPAVADPGFFVGGVDLMGGVDSRGSFFSYVETKEAGPLGGGHAPGTPPTSANAQRNNGPEQLILFNWQY